MAIQVLINGLPTVREQASVSVFDRGFLYGDSVFETLRTYSGFPFALEEHLARLEWSAARVFIPMPVDRQVWRAEVARCLELAANPESFVRIMLTRGISDPLGLDFSFAHEPTRVIIAGPLVVPGPEAYQRGISAITFRAQRAGDGTGAAGAKVGNYLVAALAQHAARAAGAGEALIVDGRGEVIEGANSNLFWVRNSVLYTPPESSGILPGITRALILKICQEQAVPVNLLGCGVEDLYQAEELFVCSTLREIVPVVTVDGRSIGKGNPGPLTLRLLSAFRQQVSG